jgi:hypothetical protein
VCVYFGFCVLYLGGKEEWLRRICAELQSRLQYISSIPTEYFVGRMIA